MQREITVADELLVNDLPEETKRIINKMFGVDEDYTEVDEMYKTDKAALIETINTLEESNNTLIEDNERLKKTIETVNRLTDTVAA